MDLPIWPLLFWLSLAFILYTYAGYPLLLLAARAVARAARPSPRTSGGLGTPARLPLNQFLGAPGAPVPDPGDTERNGPGDAVPDQEMPFLSVLLTVRNEAEAVGRKVANLLTLDYPAGRMEIWVSDDASTDATGDRVGAFEDPRVRVVRYEGGIGKAEAINRTVPLTRGELLVFMDVRQAVHPQALRRMAARFADPRVGVVGGEMAIVDADGNVTDEGTGLYWRMERRLRALEADLEMLTGVSGCFLGIRREVFRPIPPGSYCEDVALVLYARAAGWKVRWAHDAQVYEPLRDPKIEFSRKVRTLVGNYQLLTQFWPLYLPWRGRTAFTLISHKLCRLFIPLALVVLLLSAGVLAAASPMYMAALGGQVGIYTLGALALVSHGSRRRSRVASACGTFCMLNGAALLAFLHVLRHGPRIGWR